jgi:hypothetical protein
VIASGSTQFLEALPREHEVVELEYLEPDGPVAAREFEADVHRVEVASLGIRSIPQLVVAAAAQRDR